MLENESARAAKHRYSNCGEIAVQAKALASVVKILASIELG